MKKVCILILLSIQFSFSNDMAWSKTGHRVIGEVAQEYISGKTKRALKNLLGTESLASIANFADEIKADRSFSKFFAWHFVNFPADKKYTDVEPDESGDIMVGIQKCIAIIKDEKSTKADQIFYLKMLVHLIGDLHQPMHAGRLEDRGGNDIQVEWFGRASNLHRLWDSNMINDYGLSYTELANKLPKLAKKELKIIQSGTIYDWVEESQELANELYDSVTVGEKLGYKYSYKYWGTVENQLQKGGVRLAKVLNDLFK
ncbi:MAG: S1/P1 Nuclease [Flavobacteriaceae bacterium]|nr:MAG: S1/P1 Nuclease [Flavobacteriaceae bacterium]